MALPKRVTMYRWELWLGTAFFFMAGFSFGIALARWLADA